MLADQPFITASHLNLLRQKYLARSDNPIVAADYDGAVGVPAIFSASVFDDLRSLSGDEGAKRVIKKYGALVRTINLPEAAIDIDTPADLEKLRA
jgi:molybdenum cofactor cytidylyltransferase